MRRTSARRLYTPMSTRAAVIRTRFFMTNSPSASLSYGTLTVVPAPGGAPKPERVLATDRLNDCLAQAIAALLRDGAAEARGRPRP